MTNLDPLFNSNRDDTAIARKGLARWFFRAMGIIFLAELTGLLNFVFYYSTFGQLQYDQPPDWTIPGSLLAMVALVMGGILLKAHPVIGSLLAGAGLIEAAVAFALIYRPDDGEGAQLFKLAMIVLAIVGLVLLTWFVRRSVEDARTSRPAA